MMASAAIVESRVEIVCAQGMRGVLSATVVGVSSAIRREESRRFFLIPIQHIFEVAIRVALHARRDALRDEIFREKLLSQAPFYRVRPLDREVESVARVEHVCERPLASELSDVRFGVRR